MELLAPVTAGAFSIDLSSLFPVGHIPREAVITVDQKVVDLLQSIADNTSQNMMLSSIEDRLGHIEDELRTQTELLETIRNVLEGR